MDLRDFGGRKADMKARLESKVIEVILYGSVAAVMVFFIVPIITLIGFSFRLGRHMTLPFDGWSLQWYSALFNHPDFLEAALNSATIALFVTSISTAIGTAAALVWGRYRFQLKWLFQSLSVAPILMPQFILGILMLMWFSVLGNWLDFSLSLATIIVGQIVYITPFAVIVVWVQVHALDPELEDAARDCGADTKTVYQAVILPLIAPGIISAAIFCFLLSWGNFYITYSLSGTTRTLPTFIFAGIAMGSSPLYAALATVTFVPGIIMVGVAEWIRRRNLAA
jgi:spermidine/putrescine transport system permease protein